MKILSGINNLSNSGLWFDLTAPILRREGEGVNKPSKKATSYERDEIATSTSVADYNRR
jgi:hypothetical protein